jgi:hypothetical protein
MAYGKVYEMKEARLLYSAQRAAGVADNPTNNTNAIGEFQLKTDMPGPAFAAVLTAPLPLTTGRRQYSWPLDGLRARQIQPRFAPGSTGELAVYEGVVLVRALGLFLEGVRGDIWETQPISLGT